VSTVQDLTARWHELAPGVRMSPLFGEGAMLNLLEFDPGAHVQEHAHPHEVLRDPIPVLGRQRLNRGVDRFGIQRRVIAVAVRRRRGGCAR